MTGRKLYDALTDSWVAQSQRWQRVNSTLLSEKPVAWAFLTSAERKTLSATAARLTPKAKKKS